MDKNNRQCILILLTFLAGLMLWKAFSKNKKISKMNIDNQNNKENDDNNETNLKNNICSKIKEKCKPPHIPEENRMLNKYGRYTRNEIYNKELCDIFNNNKKEYEEQVKLDVMENVAYSMEIEKKKEKNKYYVNAKFKPGFQDVITALRSILPSRKRVFNKSYLPATEVKPNKQMIIPILQDLVNKLNTLTYTEISLVSIKDLKQIQTTDEIKIEVDAVLDKKGEADHIIVKFEIVVTNKEKGLVEDNFFIISEVPKRQVEVYEAFIVGFLSQYDQGVQIQYIENQKNCNMYNYDKLNDNEVTDPDYVQQELQKHKINRLEEIEYRNAMLDEDGGIMNNVFYGRFDNHKVFDGMDFM